MVQVVSIGRILVQHVLPYFIKNAPNYGNLWLSSSIHHSTLERESEGLRSGGPHRAPTRGSPTIEGQLGYNKK
jgi:hypothetical protein